MRYELLRFSFDCNGFIRNIVLKNTDTGYILIIPKQVIQYVEYKQLSDNKTYQCQLRYNDHFGNTTSFYASVNDKILNFEENIEKL